MSTSRAQARYLWTTALVWAAIWIGTAVVLHGSDGFADMIPILTVGTGWFIAVVPALDNTGRQRREDSSPDDRRAR